MAKITGLGGAFLRADDPKALYAWYEKHLGLSNKGCFVFPAETQRGFYRGVLLSALFQIFSRVATRHAQLPGRRFGRGFRQAYPEGVTVDPKRDAHEYGKFGWFTDPEGNRVELWQPTKS